MRRPQTIWLIFILALAVRLLFLGQYPQGFTADEASQGYTAYSLLKTGKDEWGIRWPISSFRAFADYRAPLQTYLVIPSIALFGLNEFAVRLPSAIFGSLAILAIYLLVKQLFPDRKKLPAIAALLLAISPWHIQFSRTALEANFASFLFPMGLYFLLAGAKKPGRNLILSAIFLGLNLYSYLAAKLFVPIFLAAYSVLNFKKISSNIKGYISFAVIFLIFAAPIFTDTFWGPGNVRGKDLIISNFSAESLESIKREQYYSDLNSVSPQLSRIFSNKVTFTVQQFINNYVSYLSPSFWFTEGGREITYSVFPGNGLLYLFMLPLVVYGLYALIRINHPAKKIILIWLFIGIIPAALTKDGYRPNRVGSLLGLWEIVAALGFWELLKLIPSKFKKISIILTSFIVTVSVISYLNLYFFTSPIKYPESLLYGYRELVTKIEKLSPQYSRVIIDRGSQSQVFIAFYTKMDPSFYQDFSKEWWPVIEKKNLLFLDMINEYELGKFTFKSFDPSSDLIPGNLVVIKTEKYNPNFAPNVLDRVDYPDDTPAFYILSYVKK